MRPLSTCSLLVCVRALGHRAPKATSNRALPHRGWSSNIMCCFRRLITPRFSCSAISQSLGPDSWVVGAAVPYSSFTVMFPILILSCEGLFVAAMVSTLHSSDCQIAYQNSIASQTHNNDIRAWRVRCETFMAEICI